MPHPSTIFNSTTNHKSEGTDYSLFGDNVWAQG